MPSSKRAPAGISRVRKNKRRASLRQWLRPEQTIPLVETPRSAEAGGGAAVAVAGVAMDAAMFAMMFATMSVAMDANEEMSLA